MNAPLLHGENGSFRKPEGVHRPSANRVIQRTVVPARECKIFQPCKAENRFSNTLPRRPPLRRFAKPDSELFGTPNGGPLLALAGEAINPTAGQDAEHRQLNQTRCTLNLLESRPSPGHINSQTAG